MRTGPDAGAHLFADAPAFDVSVVVPCRNEAGFIEGCLRSVLAWDGAEELLGEVLVVDGMSTDGTRGIVEQFAHLDARVKLLDNPCGWKPQALNTGVRVAKGRWIMRIDAHATYPTDYLRQCHGTALRTGADNVGGVCETRAANASLQAAVVQGLTTHWFGVGNSLFRIGGAEGVSDTVPFGFFKREVFDLIGLFDERLQHTQDQEFNERIRRDGGVVWLNPAVRAVYYNQASLLAFLWKAMKDRGPWNPYRWFLAPYSFRWRHAVPIFFVVGLVLLVGGAAFSSVLRVGLAAGLGSYLALAVLAAAQQSRRIRRASLIWLLPPVFLAYHLCYGLGGVWGLVKLCAGTSPVQRVVPPEHGRGRGRIA